MADNSKDNPDALCLPLGIMQNTVDPFPRKIIQTPTEVIFIYEGSGTTVREVHHGRPPLPPKERSRGGTVYSVGPLGRRHPGDRNHELPGRRLARSSRAAR
jgi:hypothetical protein